MGDPEPVTSYQPYLPHGVSVKTKKRTLNFLEEGGIKMNSIFRVICKSITKAATIGPSY